MQTLSTRDIAYALRLKPATVARAWRTWVEKRSFPMPIMGANENARPRWLESDFCAWVLNQSRKPANEPTPKPQPELKLVADNSPKILDNNHNKNFLNQLLNFDGSNNVKKANQN